MKKVLSFLYFFLCAAAFFTVTAQAYIDPSAMTYIIQIVAGMAIAAGAAFGFYFRKLKRALSRLKSGDKVADKWEVDANDDDDFGLGDYPILDCDRYEDDFFEEIATESAGFANDHFEIITDKYDESGCDLLKENQQLRKLLAEERAKTKVLTEKLKKLKSA